MWHFWRIIAFCTCLDMVFGKPSFSIFLSKSDESTLSTDITSGQIETMPNFQIIFSWIASSPYFFFSSNSDFLCLWVSGTHYYYYYYLKLNNPLFIWEYENTINLFFFFIIRHTLKYHQLQSFVKNSINNIKAIFEIVSI